MVYRSVQAAQHRATDLEQQVLVERSVNRDLMQRKSEMEYQLMEALARLPISVSAPPSSKSPIICTSTFQGNLHALSAHILLIRDTTFVCGCYGL
jgi:hypothetical protein